MTSESLGFSWERMPSPREDHVDVAVGERLRRVGGRDRLDVDLGVERVGPARRGLGDRRCRRIGHADRERVLAAEPERLREDRDEHDDHDRHQRRDRERLLADALRHLAAGDEGDCPAARHRGTSGTTTSRNSSASVGRCRLKCTTVPAARAASSTRSGSAPSSRRTISPRARPRDELGARHAGEPGAVAVALHGDLHPAVAAAAVAQLLDVAGGDQPPVADDRHRLAQALDEVELVAGEHDRHAPVGQLAQHAAHHVDADRVKAGERLVEHQHLGVVHERGRELDALLVAERELLGAVVGALAQPEPLDPALGRRGRLALVVAVQPRHVDDLFADAHLRVQPALLRHVAEAPAHRGVDGPVAPADLAAVGLEHAEDDPHRGGLAGAVGADESEQLSWLDGERQCRRAPRCRRSDATGPSAQAPQFPCVACSRAARATADHTVGPYPLGAHAMRGPAWAATRGAARRASRAARRRTAA